jgi:hypothetical protein
MKEVIGTGGHLLVTLMTPKRVRTGLGLLTMNYLFIMEDFVLTAEAIVDGSDFGDRVCSDHDEISLYYGGF